MADRIVIKNPLTANEKRAWQLNITKRNSGGATPAEVSSKVFTSDGTDVTSTCLAGSFSATTSVITTPYVQALTANTEYELQLVYTIGTNQYETSIMFRCEEAGYAS